MKTFSKIFASIMLLISSSAVFAQIELVHSVHSLNSMHFYFSGTKIYSEIGDFLSRDFSGIPEGFFDIIIDKEKNTVSMNTYSNDFSSVTTKTVQLSSFDDYKIVDVDVSQHIFNNDDELEFIVTYQKKVYDYEQYNEIQKLVLFDSKGNVIKDFGKAYMIYWEMECIYIINNQPYVVIGKVASDYSYTNEIYSVPTTVNPNQLKSATLSNTTLSAFPNPAKTYVNLSYNVSGVEDAVMTITDASGRVVEQKTVNAMSDKLHLNVANYKRGMYFYEVQGYTGRFIVE